jgi:hypothetical protein
MGAGAAGSDGTVYTRRFSINDLRGKVVAVNFWASWCTECRAEMRVLEPLHGLREWTRPAGRTIIHTLLAEPPAALPGRSKP